MKSKTMRILSAVGAALCALFLFAIAAFPTLGAYAVFAAVGFAEKMTQIPVQSPDSPLGHLIGYMMYSVVFGAPAALFSGCLWFALKPHRRTTLYSFVSAAVLALITSMLCCFSYAKLQIMPSLFLMIAGIILGAFGCVIGLLLYDWLAKKLPAVFNRETVSYIIFGALTTVVSFVSQMLFSALGWHVTVNTVGSWICAVIFAYVVNKLFVFESKTDTAKAFFRELGLFVAARLASLGMELVFMFVTVELLSLPESACKLVAQIFILIANYVLSKVLIFKKK